MKLFFLQERQKLFGGNFTIGEFLEAFDVGEFPSFIHPTGVAAYRVPPDFEDIKTKFSIKLDNSKIAMGKYLDRLMKARDVSLFSRIYS